MLILTMKGKLMDNLNEAIKAYGLADIHPTANIFPLMNEEEFKMLCKDAQEHDFLNSVKITPDKILIDGRNRLLASIEINKDVDLREVIDIYTTEKKYRVLYADPAWEYKDKCKDGSIQSKSLCEHYDTMSVQQICDLPIKNIAEENAVLFLWVTSPLLALSRRL